MLSFELAKTSKHGPHGSHCYHSFDYRPAVACELLYLHTLKANLQGAEHARSTSMPAAPFTLFCCIDVLLYPCFFLPGLKVIPLPLGLELSLSRKYTMPAVIDLANTPAAPPPPGMTSNLVDPPTLWPATIVVCSCILVLTVPATLVRLFTKWRILKEVNWEDCEFLLATHVDHQLIETP